MKEMKVAGDLGEEAELARICGEPRERDDAVCGLASQNDAAGEYVESHALNN